MSKEEAESAVREMLDDVASLLLRTSVASDKWKSDLDVHHLKMLIDYLESADIRLKWFLEANGIEP